MKILIAEDEAILLKAIEFKLVREGFEVIGACDGKEGMEKIEKYNPDLIISDIMMPYATGLEIISYVRETLKRKTPIVILSLIGQEETVIKALDMGADDYVIKPFSPNELLMRVKKIINRIGK